MKRVLIVLGILVAAAAIVFLGMLLRGAGGAPAQPANPLPPSGTLPIYGNDGTSGAGGAKTGGIDGSGGSAGNSSSTAIVSMVLKPAVMDYVPTPQGVMAIAPNGAIIMASTSETIVGQADFGNLLGAWFSPDGKWLLVKSGAPDSVRWSLFDTAKKTWKDIPANTAAMAWSPSSTQLAYFARRTGGLTLTTISPATLTPKALLSLSAPDLTLAWEGSGHILITDPPSALVSSSVWDFVLSNATLSVFANAAPGAEVLWGGNKNGGLLFSAGPTGGVLSLIDSSGNATQNANFLTLPSKCVFGESAATSSIPNMQDYLFCGIPQDAGIMENYQLPDDYLQGKFATADSLYAIDLIAGKVTSLAASSQTSGADVGNLKAYGDVLYFVNRNDQRLYRVSLTALAHEEQRTPN